MDKTNLKSLKAVSEDLMFIADKLKEVAETLDAILASEELLARKEAEKKPVPKSKKELKVDTKPSKAVKKTTLKAAKTAVVEDQPKKKRGRPAKAK